MMLVSIKGGLPTLLVLTVVLALSACQPRAHRTVSYQPIDHSYGERADCRYRERYRDYRRASYVGKQRVHRERHPQRRSYAARSGLVGLNANLHIHVDADCACDLLKHYMFESRKLRRAHYRRW